MAIAMATPVYSADVTLSATNGIGTSSFASATSWSNGAAPSVGNAYLVSGGLTLRTPADSNLDYTFAGDSLKLSGASNFIFKGILNTTTNVPNTITVNNLTLDGSLVNNASNSSTAFNLAGSIAIAGTGTSTLFSNNGTINVTAPISGNSGKLLLQTNAITGRQVVLSGANTYTGNIEVTGTSGAVLASTGKLAFAYHADTGTYNSITGTVGFTFDGAFTINLTGASTQVGDSYQLVNTATLVETFGATFSVEGWTKVNGVWVSPDGGYQFIQTDGVLVKVETDSDLDGLPDSWEIENFSSITAYDGDDDPDGDFCTNLQEYNAFTDPTDSSSFPDSDSDGLPDGWEQFYFGNLLQGALDDPDNDFSTNAAEYAATTDPSTRVSFPDSDFDLISDGWEIKYFGSTAACNPNADGDGDLFTNKEEYDAAALPANQISSPDTDGDGLPDGWEVKYFRVGSEELVDAIGHTDGTLDSDSDGSTDAVEYHAGTNPLLSSSHPTGIAAYWRFEENTAGALAVGGFARDVSGGGNDMITYADYTAPIYSARAFDGNVTNTGAMNASSLGFTADVGNRYTSDNIYTPATAPINTAVFSALTVEASFRPTRVNVGQGIIGKSGNPTGAAAPYQAPFTLKVNASNQVVAGLIDGSSTAREIVGTRTVNAGSWYSAAVTVSSTTMSLWLKAPGDTTYALEGSIAVTGAWSSAVFDRSWVIGQTEFDPAANGGFTGYDSFTGDLDEIRISSRVLGAGEFLANVASGTNPDSDGDGMPDAWELTYFGNLNQLAAGDFDGDGTSNIAEFMLGLLPNNGTSFFSGSLSGSTLTWKAASGLSFTVQRSTGLASWSNVGTVAATGATATWTDPSPPVGKAVYRVVLVTP